MKCWFLVAATLFAASCSNRNEPKKPAGSVKPAEYFHVDAGAAGTIAGKIAFRGAKPPKKPISMAADAACEQARAGHPAYDESVAVGQSGGLANAFVYIQSGLEGKQFEPLKQAVVLDQHGCAFVPRVIGIRSGQPLALKNSDAVSHNIHPVPTNNREWNEQQSPQSPDVEHRFARPEIMIPVKCNVHSWMRAYIGVLDHPYFAVTGADGSFQLKNVPPGEYMVAVWHEKLGERKQSVRLAASGSANVDFTYQ